ncbi:MAG: hypothetical protein F6J97_26040 [Leptolyngbya sp. SIO4C1]|nr:hypothetical protein [Leptolyngbya sp. SIO4C1]
MRTISRYVQALRDFFDNENAGDAAFLEFEFYGLGANPALINKLKELANRYPKIDLEQLSQLPAGTLGYEYAHHMEEHGLSLLEISPDLKEAANEKLFARRYTLTHDIFHVLLDQGIDYPGELGVHGFITGQNYSWTLWLAAPLAILGSAVVKPLKAGTMISRFARGIRLGHTADCVLAYPFEQNWNCPITDVRRELGLTSFQVDNSSSETTIMDESFVPH